MCQSRSWQSLKVGAMMKFTNQDRECVVTLSPFASLRVNSAKGLSRWAKRCFAALSMTVPTLVVKLHYRAEVICMAKAGVLIDEHLEKQFAWYEASLPLMERKKRGHFSTPPSLVEQILDACGYTPDADLAQLRVLDPACGSGNFLAGAAQRLLAFSERMGLPLEERIALVQRNLWAFDPDPISCSLARIHLQPTLTPLFPSHTNL